MYKLKITVRYYFVILGYGIFFGIDFLDCWTWSGSHMNYWQERNNQWSISNVTFNLLCNLDFSNKSIIAQGEANWVIV